MEGSDEEHQQVPLQELARLDLDPIVKSINESELYSISAVEHQAEDEEAEMLMELDIETDRAWLGDTMAGNNSALLLEVSDDSVLSLEEVHMDAGSIRKEYEDTLGYDSAESLEEGNMDVGSIQEDRGVDVFFDTQEVYETRNKPMDKGSIVRDDASPLEKDAPQQNNKDQKDVINDGTKPEWLIGIEDKSLRVQEDVFRVHSDRSPLENTLFTYCCNENQQSASMARVNQHPQKIEIEIFKHKQTETEPIVEQNYEVSSSEHSKICVVKLERGGYRVIIEFGDQLERDGDGESVISLTKNFISKSSVNKTIGVYAKSSRDITKGITRKCIGACQSKIVGFFTERKANSCQRELRKKNKLVSEVAHRGSTECISDRNIEANKIRKSVWTI